ncbi:MAG: pyruvate kinase [Candidatus Moraniibacteriota bacterium]
MKKTKIVATIGPASKSKDILRKMIQAGLNVARINFSHGDYSSNGELINNLKELRSELNISLGIMVDLQGPRIRVGNEEEFSVEKGEIIFVSDKKMQEDEKELVIDSDGVCNSLKVGERILIEDGLMEVKIIEKIADIIKAEVISGGKIKPRKGVNMPDTELQFGAVTEKDEADLEYALSQEVDFIALSFVSNGKEIEETREKIKSILGREIELPQIVAKVERKEALKNIDEIISASDVIMIARGDLGIELDETKVVLYQKQIIAKCLTATRPVIVATQMLDSMIKNPIPTRAEVSDVSNAVIDHADAVMLSGESANGEYPVASVETMAKIIIDTEDSPFDNRCPHCGYGNPMEEYMAIICSAHDLAKNSDTKAILVISQSGFTARKLAHGRSEKTIFVATNSEKTYNQLAMVWGVNSFLFPREDKLEELIDSMVDELKERKELSEGDSVVVILGRFPGGEKMRLVGIRNI